MKKFDFNYRRSGIIKNIIITVLLIAVLTEGVFLVMSKLDSGAEPAAPVQPQANLVIHADNFAQNMSEELSSTLNGVLDSIKTGVAATGGISAMAQRLIYSDEIINMIMSISYPLLFDVLTSLNMMDFAANIDLFPTGEMLAEKLSESAYSCCDKDGARKPLAQVLKNSGSDWSYMNSEVTITAADGTTKKSTLWNTIVWGVTDKDSFFKAAGDMSTGLRGVLEVCLQGKTRVVSINVVEFLLNTDAVPLNLDAASIFNSSEKSGYEHSLVPLFNMLGLTDGEYPSATEFCGYTELSDIWEGILSPVMTAVAKIEQQPLDSIADLLLNFVYAVDSGSLCEGLKCLRMDAEFHKLATMVMKFESGPLYNLGQSLIEIIESMGIKISGSFNELLDSVLCLVLKSETADMPDMSPQNILACGVKTTLSNGNVYYDADTDLAVNYLIDYAIQEKTLEIIFNQTSLAGTPEAQQIITAVGQNRDGLVSVVNTIYAVLASKLSAAPAQ